MMFGRAAVKHARIIAPSGRAAAPLSSLSLSGGVHGTQTRKEPRAWRNRPLLRVHGDDQFFRTGAEAVALLKTEMERRDGDKALYADSAASFLESLEPVFDRSPRYAWLAKIFLEPERAVSFRVAYIDDSGNTRTNRGFRIQHSSTLGPYEGGLHFGPDASLDRFSAMAFDATFGNALTGQRLGGAVGGANFDPSLASEAEIQRFCQSFMTELQKYVGVGRDLPTMGVNVGRNEVGYLYGQYKRTSTEYSKHGRGLLWGGAFAHPEVFGASAVAFAAEALRAKGQDLRGKRCLITGSGKVALSVAESLLAAGAVPLTFSDSSGHVYEPEGIPLAKLRQISQIKAERGARIGRYIIASTTAKYNDPESIWNVRCDLAFPTAGVIDGDAATTLADNGCAMVVDAGHFASSSGAVAAYKRLGVAYAPFKASMAAGTAVASASRDAVIVKEKVAGEVAAAAARVHDECARTAQEFGVRGDLHAGANIASFLRVATVMAPHGAI